MKLLRATKFASILFFFVVIISCNNKPVKVGVLFHTLDISRWEKDKKYITERVQELKGDVYFRLAHQNQQTQINQAKELIEMGIDVLIVIPVHQEESAEVVRIANDSGIKVIAYDRLIKGCSLDYYVTTNSVRVGEMMAKYMVEIMPKGKYALIIGDKKDNNSLMLFLGQMNVLQEKIESGDIHIIYSEFTNSWTEEAAYKHALNVLELRDSVDVIICGADVLAYGVNRALEEAGLLGKVKVISQNADLKAVRSVVRGEQAATIYKPYKKTGYKAAELAIDLAKGKEIEKNYSTVSNGKKLVPSFRMEPMLVNENTISSTVIAEGHLSSEEIYQ